MDFHDYNGVDYVNSLSASSPVPSRISWDDHYMYSHIFGGAVVITFKMEYYSPVKRMIEIERIRVLDLIDIPSIPFNSNIPSLPVNHRFYVGMSELQTLISVQERALLQLTGIIDGQPLAYTYNKYQNTNDEPGSWPTWLVVQGHRLFNVYRDASKRNKKAFGV
jgi:hypothetical protein